MKSGITTYTEKNLDHIAFPLGGLGAGMFCIEGSGSLTKFSIKHEADLTNEPLIFSAVSTKYQENIVSKIIEGQVPKHKIFSNGGYKFLGFGNGLPGKSYGLPRLQKNSFKSLFPFAYLKFKDSSVLINVSVCGFSPFIPLDSKNSSLPVASLEYAFDNPNDDCVDVIFYLCAQNFVHNEKETKGRVYQRKDGFILHQEGTINKPHLESDLYISLSDSNLMINTDWFMGGWFDILTMQWNDIAKHQQFHKHQKDNLSPGGTLSLSFMLKPKEKRKIIVKFAWYTPYSNLLNEKGGSDPLNAPCCKESICDKERFYQPYYASLFNGTEEVMQYFSSNYDYLYQQTLKFTKTFYQMTLPNEAIEAISANLSILKSPTILRQKDGRLWSWEGCFSLGGCCHGSCTHVLNYAQTIAHLFPDLERSLRKTEFCESQNSEGHQSFRSSLPIGESKHDFHAASDGQLGGIIKLYRDYLIYGNKDWLKSLFQQAKSSLDYCINKWDPKNEGVLKEMHHNTYDIEFYGADGMCSSIYLASLLAFINICKELSEDYSKYQKLYNKGKIYIEKNLFNGEYFIQQTDPLSLKSPFSNVDLDENVLKLLQEEGPKYQYKNGCLADGILGCWLAKVSGLEDILNKDKIISHLLSVYKYNYKNNLINHANPQRSGFAHSSEGGLLLCTWPHNDKPSLPFVYSDEIWTGVEYQVASHLIFYGYEKNGLDIIKTCRKRYDGTLRNPYAEYECGFFYARAMSSYSLILAFSGISYDASKCRLLLTKKLNEGFKTFICTNSGYGLITIKNQKVVLSVISGTIKINQIIYNNN